MFGVHIPEAVLRKSDMTLIRPSSMIHGGGEGVTLYLGLRNGCQFVFRNPNVLLLPFGCSNLNHLSMSTPI